MSNKSTSSDGASPGDLKNAETTDWAAFDALTDEEVEAAALADPDAQPLTEDQLKRARRVGLAGSLRFKLKLSREEFASRYHIPIETVRGWERGMVEPDAVAKSLLELIAADPVGVAKILAAGKASIAAE